MKNFKAKGENKAFETMKYFTENRDVITCRFETEDIEDFKYFYKLIKIDKIISNFNIEVDGFNMNYSCQFTNISFSFSNENFYYKTLGVEDPDINKIIFEVESKTN